MKEQLEEESGAKEDVLRLLGKSLQEADVWRAKYEQEGLAKAEELEMAKMKLQARLAEAQGTIEQLNSKLGQVEKSKLKIQQDIEEMSAQADQALWLELHRRHPRQRQLRQRVQRRPGGRRAVGGGAHLTAKRRARARPSIRASPGAHTGP